MLDLAAPAVAYGRRINKRELSDSNLNGYSGTSHADK